MTKEELKQEAVEYVCKRNPIVIKGWFINAFKNYDKGEKVKYLKNCEIAEYEAYLASADPREKRIAELEETIKRLQKQILEFTRELHKSNKENAELNKFKRECETSLCRAEYQYNYEQLTKAKELLERFLGLGNLWDLDCKDYFPLRKEVEQFLNSEVEK